MNNEELENGNQTLVLNRNNSPDKSYLEDIYGNETDESLKVIIREQYAKNSESNRALRQNVYRKIIKIMIGELIFIGILLALMFAIPLFEATGIVRIPFIQPSIFIAVSVFSIYLFYSAGFIPSFYFTSRKLHIKKTVVNGKRITRAVIILLFCLFLAWCKKEELCFDFTASYQNNDYTGMFVVIETVFAKTTLLLSFIIRGLFKHEQKENNSDSALA